MLGNVTKADEELPDDIEDKKHISIPDKRELDLGKPLLLDFAREFLSSPHLQPKRCLPPI